MEKLTRLLNLSDPSKSDILDLNDNTINTLLIKHPPAAPIDEYFVLNGPVEQINPIIYDAIYESMVMRAASNTRGAAGPSKLDGEEWKKNSMLKFIWNSRDRFTQSNSTYDKKNVHRKG